MPIIHRLVKDYPALNFEINFSNKINNLDDEHIDVAVRIGVLQDSMQFIARQLGIQTIYLCASPEFLARYPAPHSPEALQHIPCLMSQPYQHWPLQDSQGETHLYSVSNGIILDDIMAIRDAALAGLGIARLPDWIATPLVNEGLLMPILPDLMPKGRPIHVIWPAGKYLTHRQRIVINAFIEYFSASLPWKEKNIDSSNKD